MIQQLHDFRDLALMPAAPKRLGLRNTPPGFRSRSTRSQIGPEEAAFIAARDSFYLQSPGKNGQPYIQYRRGSRGFLRMLDAATLGFAVCRGSRQYISNDNLFSSLKTCLSLTDYSSLRSLKISAETEISEDLPMREVFSENRYDEMIDRIFLFHVQSFDWICPHLVPAFNAEAYSASVDFLVQPEHGYAA